MRKKILSFLLVLTLIVAGATMLSLASYAADDVGYGIWVNGEEFTSEKTVIECGDGYAELDADAEPKVVTLDNAVITKGMTYTNVNGEHMAGIRAAEDLVIEVVGDNLIRLPAKNSAVSITGVDSTSNVNVTSEEHGYLRIETGEPKTNGDSIGFASDKTTTIEGFVIVDVSIPSARGIGYSGGFAIAGESTFAAECGRRALYGRPNIDNYESNPWIYSNESGSIKEIDLRIVDDFYAEADQATFALIGNYEYKEHDVYVDNIEFTSFRETVFCKAGKAYLNVYSEPYTLTLDNAVITKLWNRGEYPAGVRAFRDINIVLKGNNYIKLDSDSSADSISGISGDWGSYKGDLVIEGDGYLRIELGRADSGNGDSYGLSAQWVTVEDDANVSIDATVGSNGMGVNGTLILNDYATFTAYASDEVLFRAPSFDNYVYNSPYVYTESFNIIPGGFIQDEAYGELKWIKMSNDPYETYDIWVNGLQFDNYTPAVFCGTNGGYATYDYYMDTLTLDNAYINRGFNLYESDSSTYDEGYDIEAAIIANTNIISINLIGENEIFFMDGDAHFNNIAGIFDLTYDCDIRGEGTLNITTPRSGDAFGFGIIPGENGITLMDGTEVSIFTHDWAVYGYPFSENMIHTNGQYIYAGDDFASAVQITDPDAIPEYMACENVYFLNYCDHRTGEETIPAVAPTCTQTGLTEGEKCSVCGEVLTEQAVIDKTGHKEEILPATVSTCSKSGLTEGKKCSVCGEILLAQQELALAKHTVKIIPGKAPTCKNKGTTEAEVCSVCNAIIKEPQSIPATGMHNSDAGTITSQPTYTADGLKIYKCTVCGSIMKSEILPKLVFVEIKGIAVTKTKTTSIAITWTPAEGATGYVVYYSVDGKTWSELKTTATKATVKKLKAGTKYEIKVKALKGTDEIGGSSVLVTATKPKKVTVKTVKSVKAKQITVTWTKLTGVNGYEVICATNKKFTKDVKKATAKKAKKVKLTVKKLKSGKKYFVKVRAYKTVNGEKIYGAYSKVKAVKVK